VQCRHRGRHRREVVVVAVAGWAPGAVAASALDPDHRGECTDGGGEVERDPAVLVQVDSAGWYLTTGSLGCGWLLAV